jgi:hypothetical protein
MLKYSTSIHAKINPDILTDEGFIYGNQYRARKQDEAERPNFHDKEVEEEIDEDGAVLSDIPVDSDGEVDQVKKFRNAPLRYYRVDNPVKKCHRCGKKGHYTELCEAKAEDIVDKIECQLCSAADHDMLDCRAKACFKCNTIGH